MQIKKLLKYRGKRNWKASGEGAVGRIFIFFLGSVKNRYFNEID